MKTLQSLIAAAASVGMIAATSATASAAQPVVVITSDACDAYATSYANAHVGPRARPVIIGTLAGAGAGFLVGGLVFARPGLFAAVGAGAGALTGAAIGNPRWDSAYNTAFGACLQGYVLPY
jgi:uncharacterized membrane protein